MTSSKKNSPTQPASTPTAQTMPAGQSSCEQPTIQQLLSNFKNNNPLIYKQMDKNNQNALDIGVSKGSEEMIKHMFKDPESGRKLSYAEMRMRYG